MRNVRIAIRDSTDSHSVGYFDNQAGIKFKSANLTRFLAGSASMLSLSFNSKDIDTVKTGCKLSFVYKNKPYWLNVMDIQKTGFKINLIAYSLVLEINNEQKGSYKSDKAQSIAQYVRIFDPENSLTIGINEVADKSIKLEWTGTDTLLDRLYSIANSFDAELEFVTETNSDYSLRRHVLNIYRKGNLGKDLTGQPVRVGKDLKVINYSDNIKELYSAVYATGKDGLTIAGLTKTVNDDAGKPLYVTDGACLRAPQTRDRFPAVGRNSADNYLLLDLGSTEYETKEALYGYMLAELKKASVPKVSYTAEGSMDGEIGDKMTLIDDLHFDPPLYVQARISEMTEDIITGRVTETTFTNYERKYSQLSDDLLKRVEELAKEAMPYTLELATNNGTVFKNGAGNSQITPTLKRGSETISGASFVWIINGTSTTASTYTVSAAAVSGTAVVKVEAILAGKVVATTEVTFTDVSDGADGVAGKDGKGITGTVITYGLSSSETTQPTNWTASVPTLVKGQYLWTKTVWTYTDNTNETGYTKTYIAKDGNNGTDGIAGKDGVGISSTTITYGQSASGTTQPTTWTSTVPSVPSGQYLWTKTVWTYTDNTNETGYSVARMGADGQPIKDNLFSATNFVLTKYAHPSQPTILVSWKYNGKPNTKYTLSTDIPKDGNGFYNLFFWTYPSTPSSSTNGVAINEPRTITSDATGIVEVTARIGTTADGIIAKTSHVKLEENDKMTAFIFHPDDQIGPKGLQGPKGDSTGIAISATEPSTKYVNMLWKHTGNVSGLITGATYRWTGSKWELYLFTAANISADTISAITADLGEISGGSLELLKSEAQATSVDAWGNFTIPAHKWGLYIDNIGAISSGTPVRKSSSESTASDMPVAVLRSGQLRFARVDQNNDLESVLHYGLSDPDNAAISFGVAPDGTKELLIQANGQIVNRGTNYTWWNSTGVAGVYYKRQGDVVALKMQVTTTANQSLNLGKIPVSLVPIPNNGTMMRVTAWTAEQSFGRNLQISSDGSMALLASSRGDTFNTQVTWII